MSLMLFSRIFRASVRIAKKTPKFWTCSKTASKFFLTPLYILYLLETSHNHNRIHILPVFPILFLFRMQNEEEARRLAVDLKFLEQVGLSNSFEKNGTQIFR